MWIDGGYSSCARLRRPSYQSVGHQWHSCRTWSRWWVGHRWASHGPMASPIFGPSPLDAMATNAGWCWWWKVGPKISTYPKPMDCDWLCVASKWNTSTWRMHQWLQHPARMKLLWLGVPRTHQQHHLGTLPWELVFWLSSDTRCWYNFISALYITISLFLVSHCQLVPWTACSTHDFAVQENASGSSSSENFLTRGHVWVCRNMWWQILFL